MNKAVKITEGEIPPKDYDKKIYLYLGLGTKNKVKHITPVKIVGQTWKDIEILLKRQIENILSAMIKFEKK